MSNKAGYHRLMSISEADFFRLLPRALAGHTYRIDGDQILVELDSGTALIRLTIRPPRKLAMIVLPVMAVDISFACNGADVQAAFMRRFDRAYQRGGG